MRGLGGGGGWEQEKQCCGGLLGFLRYLGCSSRRLRSRQHSLVQLCTAARPQAPKPTPTEPPHVEEVPPPLEMKKIIEHSNGKPPPGDCPAPPATSRRVSRPSRCAPRPGPPLWTPFQARGCREAPRHVLPRQESQTAPWPGQSATARPADGPSVRPLPALRAPRAPAAALGGRPPVKNLAGTRGKKGGGERWGC